MISPQNGAPYPDSFPLVKYRFACADKTVLSKETWYHFRIHDLYFSLVYNKILQNAIARQPLRTDKNLLIPKSIHLGLRAS